MENMWDDMNMNMPMSADVDLSDLVPIDEVQEEYNNDPYLNYLMLFRKRRSNPTITQLCCKQSCTLRTLINFCPA
jgi:hypothetical protein